MSVNFYLTACNHIKEDSIL